MASRSLEIRSFAKINLDLRVLHKSGGFHELRTVFQTVSLHDTIGIQVTASRKRELSIEDRFDIPDNLILRAARLVLDELKVNARVHFTLTKRIPMGAGLGGGSSNAAAVLRALPGLLGKKLDAAKAREWLTTALQHPLLTAARETSTRITMEAQLAKWFCGWHCQKDHRCVDGDVLGSHYRWWVPGWSDRRKDVADRISRIDGSDLSALGPAGPLPPADVAPPTPEELGALEPGQRRVAVDLERGAYAAPHPGGGRGRWSNSGERR